MNVPGPQTHGETIDQAARRRFESAWLSGRPEPIEALLPAEDDANYLPTLEELVRAELQLAWQSWSRAAEGATGVSPVPRGTQGQAAPATPAPQDATIARPAGVESYLARFPRLNQPEIVLRLLRQERAARRQCGEEASIEEYRRRFPQVPISEQQLESPLPLLSQSSQKIHLAETLATGLPGGAAVVGAAPQDFGNYESLEEIGRGGMGVVYRARQRTADRVVALKVIRRDRLEQLPRDTHANALERFRHEAQAAAKLEHENIVTVYEVGEIDQQPFFSMRYVEGRSLAEILREGPMENRRAAAYLEPVARAVHEAHCQGILHRDLKPQNILVDKKTDRALVADFGLAKLAEGGDELTRAGEIMGTPSYMSPEQAKDSANVTAKTDVYALGATLYHVLTARPPFQAATPLETLRQVIDEEPAPPRQLNPSIDRDLETICLRCLQKEPTRRYDSAHALADDLRRYLDGEPIQARPIGTLGRVWRWCRRKPALATAIGLAATFFVVGSVVSTAAWFQTHEALKQSEASFNDAQGAVDDFLTLVGEETLLNQPAMQPLQRKLLAKARDYYLGFLSRRGDDPTVRDAVGLAHFRVGLVTEKIDSPEVALRSYYRARDMQQQLVDERPDDRQRLQDRLQNLGDTWTAIGRTLSGQQKFDDARKATLKAIEVRDELTHSAGPAETEFRRKLANSCMNLGIIEMRLGIIAESSKQAFRHFEEAAKQLSKAQVIRDDILVENDSPETRRDRAKGHFSLAQLAWEKGVRADTEKRPEDATQSFAEAEANLVAAAKVFQSLLAEDPEVLADQYDLATCHRALGDLEAGAMGDPDSARRSYQEALLRMKTLVDGNPAVPNYKADLAGLHMNAGQLEREQNQLPRAREEFQAARDILQPLVDPYPEVPSYRRDLAVTLREMAKVESAAGEHAAARRDLALAEQHFEKLSRDFPGNAGFREELKQTKALLDSLPAVQPEQK